MAQTPNLGLNLPVIGGDIDLWPGLTNDNWGILDIEVAAKLSREGGSMEGALGASAGTLAAPGLYFGSSPDSGFYAAAASEIDVSIAGVKVGQWNSTSGYVGGIIGVNTSMDFYNPGVGINGAIKPVTFDANNGGLKFFTRVGGTLVGAGAIDRGKWGINLDTPAATLDVNGSQAWNAVNIAAGLNIDLSLGVHFYKTITANTTLAITNPAAGRAAGFILQLTNPGAFTLTWPASVKWPNGVQPAWTLSGVDVVVFLTLDGGATWRASRSQAASA